MIHLELHHDDICLYEPDVLARDNVQRFLASVDEHAPTIDLTWDRAVLIGLLATEAVRSTEDLSGLQEHRRVGAMTFDADDYDTFLFAALTILDPGFVPPGTIETLLGVPPRPDGDAS